MSQTTHHEALSRANREIHRRLPLMRGAALRQRYHFMPPTGWMNDPNGLVCFRGNYHFFYQCNPYDIRWGPMHWGHAISQDLFHWQHLPVALAPSEPYDLHERGGCFSGSAIEHGGQLYLFYTGAVQGAQSQCVAVSEDGIHFTKHSANPVIPAPPEGCDPANFRDPKVWRHGDHFYLVCASTRDGLGLALLYRSRDLLRWEYVNVLHESRGEWGTMWECPDVFPVGNRHVLTISPMGAGERTAVYFVGDLDYSTGRFHPASSGELDWGFDFYAPQSFADKTGRRILVAWANGWDWMPWFRDWGPTHREHWTGAFTLPREVCLHSDHTLRFPPVRELQALRRGEATQGDLSLIPGTHHPLQAGDGIHFELLLEVDLTRTSADALVLHLRSDGTRETAVTLDFRQWELRVDRSRADDWSHGTTRSSFRRPADGVVRLHIFSDRSSVEVFADDYRTAHSCNIYPGPSQNHNVLTAHGGAVFLSKITAYEIAPPDPGGD